MSLAERIDIADKIGHDGHYKLDKSYPSSRMLKPCTFHPTPWQHQAMEQQFDMDILRANLRRVMDEKRAKPTALSLKVSSSRTLVKDIFEKNADVRLGTIFRLAHELEVDVAELIEPPNNLVPLEFRQNLSALSDEDRARVQTFVRALAQD